MDLITRQILIRRPSERAPFTPKTHMEMAEAVCVGVGWEPGMELSPWGGPSSLREWGRTLETPSKLDSNARVLPQFPCLYNRNSSNTSTC